MKSYRTIMREAALQFTRENDHFVKMKNTFICKLDAARKQIIPPPPGALIHLARDARTAQIKSIDCIVTAVMQNVIQCDTFSLGVDAVSLVSLVAACLPQKARPMFWEMLHAVTTSQVNHQKSNEGKVSELPVRSERQSRDQSKGRGAVPHRGKPDLSPPARSRKKRNASVSRRA